MFAELFLVLATAPAETASAAIPPRRSRITPFLPNLFTLVALLVERPPAPLGCAAPSPARDPRTRVQLRSIGDQILLRYASGAKAVTTTIQWGRADEDESRDLGVRRHGDPFQPGWIQAGA